MIEQKVQPGMGRRLRAAGRIVTAAPVVAGWPDALVVHRRSVVKVVLVAAAGAAGALSRYGLGAVVGARDFPWATLGINLVGSFLLGVLWRGAQERQWPETTTVPLGLGFLGAFTTFSTFSNETMELLRTDRALAAGTYVAVSVVGGLLAAAAGYTAGRAFAG